MEDELIDTAIYLEEIQRLITQNVKNNFDEYFAKVIPKAHLHEHDRKVYNYAYVSKIPLDTKENIQSQEQSQKKLRRKAVPQKLCEKGNLTEEIKVYSRKNEASLKEATSLFKKFISISDQTVKKKGNLTKNSKEKYKKNEDKINLKSSKIIEDPKEYISKTSKPTSLVVSNNLNNRHIIFKNALKSARKSISYQLKSKDMENPTIDRKDISLNLQKETMNKSINCTDLEIDDDNIHKNKKSDLNNKNLVLSKQLDFQDSPSKIIDDNKFNRKTGIKHGLICKSVPTIKKNLIDNKRQNIGSKEAINNPPLITSEFLVSDSNEEGYDEDDCSLVPTNKIKKNNQTDMKKTDLIQNHDRSINLNRSLSNLNTMNNSLIIEKTTDNNKSNQSNHINEIEKNQISCNNYKKPLSVDNISMESYDRENDIKSSDLETFIKENFRTVKKPGKDSREFDLDSFLNNFAKKPSKQNAIYPFNYSDNNSSLLDINKSSIINSVSSLNNIINNPISIITKENALNNVQTDQITSSNQEKIININNNFNFSNIIINEEIPLSQCLNCQWYFPRNFTSSEINAHIDRCFEGNGEVDKENYLLSIKEINKLDTKEKEPHCESVTDKFLCFNCNKYSNPNMIILQKHINECLDKQNKEEKYTGKKRNSNRMVRFNPEDYKNTTVFFKKKFN